ncbi:hypothetical protein LTS08_006940 [Lithohypha guttulata]|nr:hypothetical protein LTS08_006940 [Lithohypha guttulata]
MSKIPSPSLEEQARFITEAATRLQQQLDTHGFPQPGFEASARRDWRDVAAHPDILQTRSDLIDAAQMMLNLALGPTDTLTSLAGPTITKIEVLRTLDDLGVARVVPQEGTIHLADLAAKIGVNGSLLHRQLKVAYLMGMFQEPSPGQIAHTSFSAAIPDFSPYTQLRTTRLFYTGAWEVANSMRIWQDDPPKHHMQIPVEMADPDHRGMWKILEEDDPDKKGHEKFAAGMKALVSAYVGTSFTPYVQGFDWASIEEGLVIDIGGGNGHIEANIFKDLPGVNFLIQDLAENEQATKELAQKQGAGDRISFQVHDFFQPQPADLQPKAYILSRVLHDWQDADCVKIIQPLIPAMEKGAKLFVSERILPDGPGEVPVHKELLLRHTDILMFTLYGAKERSRGDFEALFKLADPRLKVKKVQHPPSTIFSMLEVVLDQGQDV